MFPHLKIIVWNEECREHIVFSQHIHIDHSGYEVLTGELADVISEFNEIRQEGQESEDDNHVKKIG